jgi:hypothetical protein
MIKSIKSMKNVRVLLSNESLAIRGGSPMCTIRQLCPDGWCCNYGSCDSDGNNCICQQGGAYGGCLNP